MINKLLIYFLECLLLTNNKNIIQKIIIILILYNKYYKIIKIIKF